MKNLLRAMDPALAEESYRATPDENEEEDSVQTLTCVVGGCAASAAPSRERREQEPWSIQLCKEEGRKEGTGSARYGKRSPSMHTARVLGSLQ